ncbi:MAG TPA: S9 family peptidase [Anaeromyxobacteraceae bacterium]
MGHLLLAALLLAGEPASGIAGVSPAPGNPNLLQLGVPEVPEALRERMAQYQEARSAQVLDAADDGGAILVATRFGSTTQLHVVDRPLGAREQITFFEEPVGRARFAPGDPRAVWFLRDRGGGEFHQLHRLDRRTGRAERLTDGKSRNDQFVLSRDGSRVAWASTARNGKDMDVWLAEAAAPAQARRVVEGEGTYLPLDFSPDGARILVRVFRSIADADLLLVDVATGAVERLTPREGKGSVRQAAFTADGKGVWLVTDRWNEFNELVRLDLGVPRRPPRAVTHTIRWDVEHVAVSRDGSRVALAVNAGGVSRLYLHEPRTGRLAPVELPAGVVGGMLFPARRPNVLFLTLQSAARPADVWRLDLGSRKLERWTRSEVGGLDPERFVEPELVRYPSADGVAVPAFLLRPPARPKGRVPVVVVWHGGPEAQSRPLFSPLAQFWALEMGFAVLSPNVRGSDGYGKAWLAADDGPRREQALADIGATLDYVASQPDLDPARVAVYGGSYGGYMVLATLAFHPGRVRAGVDVVGISSLTSFLESTQAYRRDLRRAEYGDERDPAVRAVLDRISPLLHADRMDAALFVQQGKNDPRVAQSESEQIVRALQAKGREVWYLLGLNEGHGFRKKENRDHALLAATMFLERALAAHPAAAPSSSPWPSPPAAERGTEPGRTPPLPRTGGGEGRGEGAPAAEPTPRARAR